MFAGLLGWLRSNVTADEDRQLSAGWEHFCCGYKRAGCRALRKLYITVDKGQGREEVGSNSENKKSKRTNKQENKQKDGSSWMMKDRGIRQINTHATKRLREDCVEVRIDTGHFG